MNNIIENQYGYFQKRNGNILLIAETKYGNSLSCCRPFRTLLNLHLSDPPTVDYRVFIILPNRLECPFISDALNIILAQRADCVKHRNFYLDGKDLYLLEKPLPLPVHHLLCQAVLSRGPSFPLDSSAFRYFRHPQKLDKITIRTF
jgi:hypothetical protein